MQWKKTIKKGFADQDRQYRTVPVLCHLFGCPKIKFDILWETSLAPKILGTLQAFLYQIQLQKIVLHFHKNKNGACLIKNMDTSHTGTGTR